jgi:hypothetical protein
MYGKIIISEVFLPYKQKTIKPISIGGVAGGEKYIHRGILFKFAMDWEGLYGGDEYSAKVASHELKGLARYFSCAVRGLHFPLMALIDYRYASPHDRGPLARSPVRPWGMLMH